MTRTLPLAVLLLVAACNRQDEPAAPAPTAGEAPAAPVVPAEVPSLGGAWRMTTPAALDLTISGASATLSSGCLRRGYRFTQAGAKVTFTSDPSGSANCGRTPSAAEETAFAALGDANLAIFGKDGSVTLSGLGGMIALERR